MNNLLHSVNLNNFDLSSLTFFRSVTSSSRCCQNAIFQFVAPLKTEKVGKSEKGREKEAEKVINTDKKSINFSRGISVTDGGVRDSKFFKSV